MKNKNMDVINSKEVFNLITQEEYDSVNYLFNQSFLFYDGQSYKIDENIYNIIDDYDYEFKDFDQFIDDFVFDSDKKDINEIINKKSYRRHYFKIKTHNTVKNIEFLRLNKNNDKFPQVVGVLRCVSDDFIKELDIEFLVKEIHHRIKNTLQVLNSLLSLDARFNKDNPEKTVRLTQHRINSLSIIYKNAYDVQFLSEVDFKYFMVELIDYLKSAYSTIDEIVFEDDFPIFTVNIDIIIPISLIIVEVIDNIVKNACDNGSKCRLKIKLDFSSENKCNLIIESDLKTFKFNDIDEFGIALINMLIDQIDGSLDLSNDYFCSINFCKEQV